MTPLLLVVGFLGAGKTTLLKGLARQLSAEGLRASLLLNDYQNARVDAEQFRELLEEVAALSGDCVCCGSRDAFFEMLRSHRHEPDKVMLVETNGTTDPGPLIEALALDPELIGFTSPLQVAVIDCKRWQKRFWHNGLEREQARTASHVFLSRQDEVGPERLADVRASLARAGVRGRETTLEALARDLRAAFAEPPRLVSPTPCGCGGGGHGDHHHHAPHCHDESFHFASCEFPLPDLVDRAAFSRLLADLPDEVIRAKGLVRFVDEPGGFHVFQKIGSDVQFFPVGPSPRLATPLALFIGPSLDRDALAARFGVLATPGPV